MLTTKEVRRDCIRLSKCGMRSVQWCRSHRDTCEECRGCTLIHSIRRSNMKVADGVVMRRCGHCGEFYPLSCFYRKNAVKQGKVYPTYSSWCCFCISRKNYEKRKAMIMAER